MYAFYAANEQLRRCIKAAQQLQSAACTLLAAAEQCKPNASRDQAQTGCQNDELNVRHFDTRPVIHDMSRH